MKAVILAGGLGSRLSEETHLRAAGRAWVESEHSDARILDRWDRVFSSLFPKTANT